MCQIVIRVDDTYNTAPGDLAASDLTDAKVAQRNDFAALAHIILATSATAS